ncbi:unnamed protein product [Pseudo-nitzschia multistriata]|uniref:Uncharacterized protein n=1 Tax=Pseudo-nitzschia multistriata TaxID=183589 RepID=A0A448ZTA1_9STRA|nr:unnamed protein product [Pseudo-nitzschia multistriata]
MSNTAVLQRLSPSEVTLEIKDPVNPRALEQAKAILSELVPEGSTDNGRVDPSKLLEVAKRLGDVEDGTTVGDLIVSKEACEAAYLALGETERVALTNMHRRIKAFADLQRASIRDTEMDIPGGKAGHTVSPCRAAGCYAPGGRYPLPSSVLMTAVTARAAGCPTVVLSSPKPAPITLAAAHVAGADVFLRVGGAQAIAAMAFGMEIQIAGSDGDDADATRTVSVPSCDVICGPGNMWVTAAKSIVSGKCGIDMLAGPSEVLVICDETAEASVVASDLIAQAEHDVVARAILLSTCGDLINAIDAEVEKQVNALPEPNRSTAMAALKQSFAVHCEDIAQCISISDDIAPEHLEVQTKDSNGDAFKCANYGGLFIGVGAAEVLGDYGAGPNHTLPTGGTGRYTGGLSVFNFLRIRTWMRVDDKEASQGMVDDSIVMARLEGLEGHARAAEQRKL